MFIELSKLLIFWKICGPWGWIHPSHPFLTTLSVFTAMSSYFVWKGGCLSALSHSYTAPWLENQTGFHLFCMQPQVHDGTLTILGITRDDRGAYTCRAYSDQGEVLHTTRLLVQGTVHLKQTHCKRLLIMLIIIMIISGHENTFPIFPPAAEVYMYTSKVIQFHYLYLKAFTAAAF